MNKIKDFTGVRFGKLVALEPDLTRDRTYWKFRCDCGEVLSRVPNLLKKNKYNACRTCMTNGGAWAWKGCGEIPHDVYTTIKHSALQKDLALEVSIEYLWDVYLKQNGKCIFTGLPIQFNKTNKTKTSKTASLDRIDSSKGYIEGNIQWVHRDINKLKKNFSDERFLELCISVAINKGYRRD